MSTSIEPKEQAPPGDRPFAHLRATPEERAQILSALTPFDTETWMQQITPATPEEVAALEDFLQEREELRRQSLEREEERLSGLGE